MAEVPLKSTTVVEWARATIQPLCDGTKQIVEPLRLSKSDRLSIDLEKNGNWFVVSVSGQQDGRTFGASFAATHDYPRRIPERSEKGQGHDGFAVDPGSWRFAATDLTVVITSLLWPREQIIFRSPEAQLKFDYLLVRYAGEMGGAEIRARFRFDGTLPDTSAINIHPYYPLGPHQAVGVMSTMGLQSFALFMDRGTGKTYTLLTRAIEDSKKIRATKHRMGRVVIVCPKSARYNWKREIEKFTTVVCKVTIVQGGEVERLGALTEALTDDEDCVMTVLIFSYDMATRMSKILSAVPWDLTALDESHRIKNVYAKRWKKIMPLRDASTVRAILTGTPITNQVLDLYTQLEFLEEGGSGFINFKAFKNFYTKYAEVGNGQHKVVGFQNLPLLQERFARMAFHITKDEALPHLPPKLYETIACSMSKEQLKAYKELATQLMTKFESELASGKDKQLTTQNILTQLLRLAQITGGMIKWDDTFNEETGEMTERGALEFFNENDKLDKMIAEIKATGPNEKHLIWSCFVPLIGLIMNRLEKEGIGAVSFYGSMSDQVRNDAEYAFNCDPNVKVIVLNQAAGGEAINLRGYDEKAPTTSLTNTSQEHFYAVNWSVVQRLQAEDRAHRNGTRVPVTIKDYVVPGSIDERLRTHVNDKIETAKTIQDVKDILQNIMASLDTLVSEIEEDNDE